MKNIPDDLLVALSTEPRSEFFLFKVGPNDNGDVLRYTTLPYDHEYNTEVYSSGGSLVGIDTPRVSDSLDRESFQVIISDNDHVLRPVMDDWYMFGAPFKVYLGYINMTGATYNGILPNTPFPDKMIAYEGTVDTYSYSITPDDEIILTMEGTSPMSSLDLTRTILTSKAYLEEKYPNDTSYEYVTEKSDVVTVKWGK